MVRFARCRWHGTRVKGQYSAIIHEGLVFVLTNRAHIAKPLRVRPGTLWKQYDKKTELRSSVSSGILPNVAAYLYLIAWLP